MPALATLGHAAESAVQQAWDLDLVEHRLKPCQLEEFVLVAGAGPAAVQPQQVAPDRAHCQALSGVAVALGVVQDLLVAPPAGSLHPGGQPVHADRLAGRGHLHQHLAQVIEAGDEGAVGLAEAEGARRAKQQVQAVADLGLGDADHPCARRYDSPFSTTAATASRRTSSGSGGVPPVPGRRIGPVTTG
jgi:hypothetical protein